MNQKLNQHSKWYKCQPLRIHQINGFMKTLAEIAELPGRKTNHSARKTTVQKLCNSGIPDSTVLQVSGHRNVHSLKSHHSNNNNLSLIFSVATQLNQIHQPVSQFHRHLLLPTRVLSQTLQTSNITFITCSS